jgi:Uma2 family endonuclease
MSSAAPLPRMSAAEYLAWEREQAEKHDWYEGEVYAMSGGTLRHAALGANVSGELRNAFRGGPCRVLSADAKVVAHADKHYVYPDVTVVCGPPQALAGTRDVLENPSILVEVLSATTESYDRGLKWSGYQRIGSLTDYLLVSQSVARIEHFQRRDGGAWSYRAFGPGEAVLLANGATLAVDAVFEGAFDLEGDSAPEPKATDR